MCGRYTLISNVEAIRHLFQVPDFDERLVVPRYNIAPTQPVVVVRQGIFGRELVPMRWGFIPSWAKDHKPLPLLLNARAEGITEKPAFRNAFRRRRCLVPASGFYEWRKQGKAKQPFGIRPSVSELVAFAGVWETWFGNDGSEIDTVAVITTACNVCLRDLHDRMPAVIHSADFPAWLAAETDLSCSEALLRPAPDDLFLCAPVSTRVNTAAYDDPGLWEPITDGPAPVRTEAPTQPDLF